MKKIFLLFSYLLIICATKGQTVNGVPLKEINQSYIMIMGAEKIISSKLNITVDLGQKTSSMLFKDKKEVNILDKDGKVVDFNSMVDTLLFFADFGYKYVDGFTYNPYGATASNSITYQWLLEKK